MGLLSDEPAEAWRTSLLDLATALGGGKSDYYGDYSSREAEKQRLLALQQAAADKQAFEERKYQEMLARGQSASEAYAPGGQAPASMTEHFQGVARALGNYAPERQVGLLQNISQYGQPNVTPGGMRIDQLSGQQVRNAPSAVQTHEFYRDNPWALQQQMQLNRASSNKMGFADQVLGGDDINKVLGRQVVDPEGAFYTGGGNIEPLGGKKSDASHRAAGWFNNARSGSRIMNEMTLGKGYKSPTGRVHKLDVTDSGFITKSLLSTVFSESDTLSDLIHMSKSPSEKIFLNQAKQWINNILRFESGAAVPIQEFKTYMQIYIPMGNDDDETLLRKAGMRELAEDMLANVGRLYAEEDGKGQWYPGKKDDGDFKNYAQSMGFDPETPFIALARLKEMGINVNIPPSLLPKGSVAAAPPGASPSVPAQGPPPSATGRGWRFAPK